MPKRKFDEVIIKDTLTKDEVLVRKALQEVYPQLQANMYKVCGDGHTKWGDDLLSVAIEYFLRFDIQKQLFTIEAGKLENLITFMANRQLKSGSSHFFTFYRKFNENMRGYTENLDLVEKDTTKVVDEIEVEQGHTQSSNAIDCMLLVKDTLDPFRKMIVEKMIMEGLSKRTVSMRYKINYYSLDKEYPIVKQILKDKCSHCFK